MVYGDAGYQGLEKRTAMPGPGLARYSFPDLGTLYEAEEKPSRTTTFPPVRRLTVWVLYPRYPPVQPTNEPNSAS